jgi:mRNA interferase MazF
MGMVRRFDVWAVALDPTIGSELRKTRPCIIVSPDETNRHLNTVVIVPLTTAEHPYLFRFDATFQGRRAQCAIDQVRVIDKNRMLSKVGVFDEQLGQQLMVLLRAYFT